MDTRSKVYNKKRRPHQQPFTYKYKILSPQFMILGCQSIVTRRPAEGGPDRNSAQMLSPHFENGLNTEPSSLGHQSAFK